MPPTDPGQAGACANRSPPGPARLRHDVADKPPTAAPTALEPTLIEAIPPVARLALAYAPAAARLPTLALFALDARLAGLLRNSREPMLAQLRLTWWRETLARSCTDWPSGEPLLAALRSWGGKHTALTELVDGWEALTGPAPLPEDALRTMALGRGAAFAALAGVLGCEREAETARHMGTQWALADLGMRLSDPRERAAVAAVSDAFEAVSPRVSRPLRPLLVLHGLARRRLERNDEAAAISPRAMLTALKLGLLGF